jgi:thiol:disulfide interchange protein DsbD
MGALQQLPADASGWRKLWKGLGVVSLIYGTLFLVGVAANGRDTTQPLRGLLPAFTPGGAGGPVANHVSFKRIKSVADLERELAAARASGKPVMLDFYADWCIYCKTLEKNVFPDPRVRAYLDRFVLLQADVTEQDEQDLALQHRFEVPAPPALIFWNAKGQELRPLRVMGDIDAEALARQLARVR